MKHTLFRIYRYVGRVELVRGADFHAGTLIAGAADVLQWVRDCKQVLDPDGSVIATFVVDADGKLRIADRHSEHVRCAGGKPVLSGGEMTFRICGNDVAVTWITNQSTGYCPEPESWEAVIKALSEARIEAPSAFSREFIFRRCLRCQSINIIKEEVFECAVCSATLPTEWNLAKLDDATDRGEVT